MKSHFTILSSPSRATLVLAGFLILLYASPAVGQGAAFEVVETTIEEIHSAFQQGRLTSRQLVQLYLDRIQAYDQKGPTINCIINVNPKALEEADRLDVAYRSSGLTGPLHGIPVILKDQADTEDMPTTLGTVMLKDYYPGRDAFVVEQLRKAGAIILAKATLGEWGGGDTFGSLFGETHNPYGLTLTVGGSSGGPAAAMAVNFATVAVGQEGLASIRRPSAWNSIVGMRPTAGLVSRSGVFSGWPSVNGTLGPMARTVTDLARLLDVMAAYDAEDPLTARGYGNRPGSYLDYLDKDALKGARIGIMRVLAGISSEPGTPDFQKVTAVFNRAVDELRAAGAVIIDPVEIPDLTDLISKRAGGRDVDESLTLYFARNGKPPFKTKKEVLDHPDFNKLVPRAKAMLQRNYEGSEAEAKHYQSLMASQEMMTRMLKLMADNQLDAIVHKSVEHLPTPIEVGLNPPYVTHKGAPHMNTFMVYVPTITVPAGFTDNLPVGISFLGRPYDDADMIRLAYSYEQATKHRRPPSTTPPLR